MLVNLIIALALLLGRAGLCIARRIIARNKLALVAFLPLLLPLLSSLPLSLYLLPPPMVRALTVVVNVNSGGQPVSIQSTILTGAIFLHILTNRL